MKLERFTSFFYSHATTAKKCTKKRDARAKLLFCYSKVIAFWPFSLPSPSSLLKLPIVVIQIFCYHGNMTSHLSSLFVWYFLNQSIQLSIGVFWAWTNLKKHKVMASGSQNWSSPERAISLWRTSPLWVINIYFFILEIQRAFMHNVSVSCDKTVLKPNCAEIATFIKE